MMRHNLVDKVYAFTTDKGLFSAPCHVLIGLSGGADSMALLHILTHWPVPGVQVSAVHIHHGLRGQEANRDEAFVRDYCAQHDVSLSVLYVDVASIAREQHFSLEEAGRRVRYEQFERIRCDIEADYVLTAHTATDQAETVLMHLVRGCGISGLAGIPFAREQIRRPLLCCHRHEVEEYCSSNDIPYVTDTTNFDIKYTRNHVRGRLMPLLREMNPSIENALLRLSRCAYDESTYLDDLATSALSLAVCNGGYLVEHFTAQSAVIRRRMIRLLFRRYGINTFEETHIFAAEKAILSGKGTVDLSGTFIFAVQQGVVSVIHTDLPIATDSVTIESLPVVVSFANREYKFEIQSHPNFNVHNLLVNCGVDYDKIQGKLCLRSRYIGDYMHPAGRGVGKSLKKWMNEWHISTHLRNSYPILCDDVGIVSVLGYACDERVCVTDDTKHFLVCTTDTELV